MYSLLPGHATELCRILLAFLCLPGITGVYTPTQKSNTKRESAVVSLTYPILIFYVDISSLAHEVSHNVNLAPLSCLMEGSPLMTERNKV